VVFAELPIVAWVVAWTAVAAVTATTRASPPLWFTDVTAEAGIEFVHTIGDDTLSNIIEASGVGCALVDFDGDGWLDIYLVNGVYVAGLSNPNVTGKEQLEQATDRLYRNRGDGTFEDVTRRAGVLPGGYGMGVAVGDYDNDGDCDIYVTNYGANRLYRNRGDGTFEEVARQAGVADDRFSVGAVFVDYDLDGDLDLYVGNYLEFDPDYKIFYAPDGFPGPTAYLSQPNCLYRNEGNGRFTDVTAESGLAAYRGRTMGVGAFDYDDDGRPDLFVANDAMENYLFHNLGSGKFTEVALLSGVAYGLNGEATGAMGIEVGDINGDGRLDFYVPDLSYTCLYENRGSGTFEDIARRAGIAASCGQYVSWGAVLADFDLDTDLDLFIANGDAHHLEGHENLVFTNDGRGRFADVSTESGPDFQRERVARGVAAGDFDNDGDIDLLVVHLNDRPVLLRNDTARDDRHWLELKLVGHAGRSNRSAFGARVRCKLPGDGGNPRILVRELHSAGSYVSAHDPRVHFGLGPAPAVTEIEIRWPDGTVQRIRNVNADRLLTIEQPSRGRPSKP